MHGERRCIRWCLGSVYGFGQGNFPIGIYEFQKASFVSYDMFFEFASGKKPDNVKDTTALVVVVVVVLLDERYT